MSKQQTASMRSPDSTMLEALELAVRAPSLHNTQPWLWRISDRSAQLYLDAARSLPAADPHDRELIISCGAALHHLQVALSSMGWSTRVTRLPDPTHPALLARVELSEYGPAANADLAEAISRHAPIDVGSAAGPYQPS